MSEAQPLPNPASVLVLVAAILGGHLAFTLSSPETQVAIEYAFALIPERYHGDGPFPFANWADAAAPLIGHAFLHFGWWHAGLNAFFFFLLGRLPALRLGNVRFLAVFFASVLGGALAFLALNWDAQGIAVGASGGVCGVFTAYFMALRPDWRESFAIPAVRNQFGMIFLLNVVAMGIVSELGWFPIAWEAHLGGFVAGGLAYIALQPRRVAGPWG